MRTPQQAALELTRALDKGPFEMTIADASAQSGLALNEAEIGLHYLVGEYRGHLSATSKGELLFSFPYKFTKPWETIERWQAIWGKAKKVFVGVAKFVVRAWITVVMVGYVVVFALILLALTLSNKNSDRDDRSSFGSTLLFHSLLRAIFDALFWTFHPFSPFYVGNTVGGRQTREKGIPFYEKVNRFFFGPEVKPEDPAEIKRTILSEIRAKQGRIGLSDVIRLTGYEREKADPYMARLMLEFDGDVSVSEQGGIVYHFPELRKTIQDNAYRQSEPIWARKEVVPPMTGNTAGSNFWIAALNGFNLLMSTVAITNGWTIQKLTFLLSGGIHAGLIPPPESAPLVLGWIPFWFSGALFLLPLSRWLSRQKDKKRIAHENGRRGLLFAIFNRLSRAGVREDTLKNAWQSNSGTVPSSKELTREVIKMGGDLEVKDDGTTYFRFRDLEAELAALQQERGKASVTEKQVGEVVFSSAQ